MALGSDFVRLETAEDVQEVRSRVSILFPVAENKVVLSVPVWRAVNREFVELCQQSLCKSLETLLEIVLLSFGDLGDDFLCILLEPSFELIFIHAGFFVLEVVDEVIDLLRRSTSSSSLFFLIFILSSEGITASDINIDLTLDNHLTLDLIDDTVEFFQWDQLVSVRNDVIFSVEVLVNSHPSTINIITILPHQTHINYQTIINIQLYSQALKIKSIQTLKYHPTTPARLFVSQCSTSSAQWSQQSDYHFLAVLCIEKTFWIFFQSLFLMFIRRQSESFRKRAQKGHFIATTYIFLYHKLFNPPNQASISMQRYFSTRYIS